ncbi:hypothetical protein AXE65_11550 [Ventosimonas gracilis]|uniref:DUF4124 domain-containing protein n=1 Tax=Ventosimonas gracilis TaxID=1680762 RepID=A0A139SW93_9GAMM|nr:DUF4124 domain-containing protein [Ventosimonas gracilis]KXU38869.1 hypothetical protein AXE65_11550 [Ventosimonas gracilis]
MRQILFLPFAVLFFTLCLASLSLADIYRYTDEQGMIVFNRQGVPPQYVDKGYEVFNEQGRVIKTVPRADARRNQADASRTGTPRE